MADSRIFFTYVCIYMILYTGLKIVMEGRRLLVIRKCFWSKLRQSIWWSSLSARLLSAIWNRAVFATELYSIMWIHIYLKNILLYYIKYRTVTLNKLKEIMKSSLVYILYLQW